MERKEFFLQEKQNHATVKTEVTWLCVSNAACPPHALWQACEEQGGLGTATPGSPLQTTATNVQIERQVNIHGNNLLTPAQARALLSSTEWPPVQLLQGTDASTNSVFMMLCQEAVPLRAATASWESKSRMLKKSVHVSGEQDICPTVRHSDWSNAKPVHKWTHSSQPRFKRLKSVLNAF